MNEEFKPLTNEEEGVSVNESDRVIVRDSMFKVGQLVNETKESLFNYSETKKSGWLEDGIECEILQFGATSWRKGKVRLKIELEFCPEEPDISYPISPLDDIRQITQ